MVPSFQMIANTRSGVGLVAPGIGVAVPNKAKGSCVSVIGKLFEYDTPKIVHIASIRVGIIFRILQLIVIAYIAGYVIAWKKGYQDVEKVESAVTTKLKGIATTNYTALNITGPGQETFRIWDVADYVIPPQENDAFFVMTNVIFTPNQTQGVCPEDYSLTGAACESDNNCEIGSSLTSGNGVMTGRCIPFNETSNKTCEVHAWCPVEIDVLLSPTVPLLDHTSNFTVLIKNSIIFKKFNQRSRNILDSQNATYLKTCHYDANDPVNRLCPVFQLGTIVSLAGIKSYNDIALLGGVIIINIHWDCNLDYSIDDCLPVYSFQRLDLADAKIAQGTNFRFASFYESDNGGGVRTMFRDLFKAYGIRVIVTVTGQAGKFSIIPLLLNIGSGIGLLAIAQLVADFILCYVLKKRNFYYLKKYLHVDDVDINDDNDDAVAGNEGEDDEPLLRDGVDDGRESSIRNATSSSNE